jgi:TolB-like protein
MTDFFAELKRRYIYGIAAAYAVAAWALLQLFNNVAPLLKVPDWTGTMLLVLLVGGFPVALVFAWMMDLSAAAALKRVSPQPGTAKPLPPLSVPARPLDSADSDAPSGAAGTPITPHSDGPSLVVLPFANLSGDPSQDFFADGLTEDIITDLSRFRHLFIISRNSAFRYKGGAVDVRQVARELRVQYVIEGSVRKVDNRVRVTVQLIDGHADVMSGLSVTIVNSKTSLRSRTR